MSKEEMDHSQAPKFLNLLNEADCAAYSELRANLSSPTCRNRRNKRLETFGEMLNSIKSFCIRNNEDDWKRCLVCGVIWTPNGIAINTRQLRLLIDKCKSSINGSLHRMGFSTVTCRGDTSNQLAEMIPILKNNFPELRQWTVRQAGVSTPQPMLPKFENQPILPQIVSPQPALNNYFPDFPTSSSIPTLDTPMFSDDPGLDLPIPEMKRTSSFFLEDEFCCPLQDWTKESDIITHEENLIEDFTVF